MLKDWNGLWFRTQGLYKSQTINKEDLKGLSEKFVIVLRYNKYYDKRKNSPKFVISFKDDFSKNGKGQENVERGDGLEEFLEVDSELDELKSIIKDGNEHVNDKAYSVQSWRKLIDEIERLTNQKIKF